MKNQLRVGVVLSYVHMGLNMMIQLIYTPVMIRMLGRSEYGLYNLVGSVVSYLSLFSLGFTGAYLRFYMRAERSGNKETVARLNGMFLTLFMGMSVLALICGGTLAQFTRQLFGENLTSQELEKAQILMYILVVNISLTFPSSLFNSIIAAHERFLFQRILTILGTIFNPLICLPLLFTGHGSVAVVGVTTLITFTTLAANIYYCKKVLNTQFSFHHFEAGLLREIAVFSSFLFLNMIIDQINWSVDKYILGRVSGTNAVAVYGVGSQINSLVITFSTAISSVFAPRINRIATESNEISIKKYDELFIKVGRIQFLVLGLIISGFVFFGRYFLTDIYVGPEYVESYLVALLLIIPAIVPLIQNLGIEIQRAMNRHQVRSIMYFAMALINVSISIPLAMKYGPAGSALGTAIGLVVANGLCMNLYYHRALKLDMVKFWKSIISLCKGLIIPAVIALVMLRSFPIQSIPQFCCYVLGYTIIYAVSMYALGMNQFEKSYAAQILRRFQRRKSV